jgi:hypothetical protein
MVCVHFISFLLYKKSKKGLGRRCEVWNGECEKDKRWEGLSILAQALEQRRNAQVKMLKISVKCVFSNFVRISTLYLFISYTGAGFGGLLNGCLSTCSLDHSDFPSCSS